MASPFVEPAFAEPVQGEQPHMGPGPADPASPEQRAKLLEDLYGRLAAAGSADAAAPIAQAIERLWRFSGSPTADLLLERAMAASQANRQDLALTFLNTTVELQPDFADAWRMRAFIYFVQNDYERALADLRRALALEPNHFRALEGVARILSEIGEKKVALEAYKSLLAVYPLAPGAREAVEQLTVEVEGQGI
jgi:tetratricopeptide (TPR) repeat protein